MSSQPKKTDPEQPGGHALITGGSSGLGYSIAKACLRRGMRVTLVSRDAERLIEASEKLTKLAAKDGRQAVVDTLPTDLAFSGEPARVVQEANQLAPLDLVCHAAGASSRGRVVETSRKDFERLMAINFLAAVEIVGAIGEQLAERKGGLVLIGSLASRVAPKHLGPYPSSKHALAAFAQQLRLELGPAGLRTLLVCPGPLRRDDAGQRYNRQAASLPKSARDPGGGAKLNAIDPDWLAERTLTALAQGKKELIEPRKARLLFALAQLSPSLGDWLLARFMKS